MFERFTDQARRVFVLAQEQTERLDIVQAGDDLLLFGLIGQPETVAGRALLDAGVTGDRLRERIVSPFNTGRHKHYRAGHVPFTPMARKVLEGALRESVRAEAPEVSAEHVLVALIGLDGPGARVLRQLEVDVDELRNRITGAVTSEPVEQTQATPWSTPKADVSAELTTC